MLDSILFPDEYKLKIDSISVENQVIVIVVSSSNEEGICPCCQRISHRVHSFYQRHPADLPIVARTVRLLTRIRRFFCDNHACERKIFAERMPALLQPYARCTNRLITHLRDVAFALGGEAGARLLRTEGIAVSPDTLLRIIRAASESEMETPRVLGIDDWAQKKGHSYGTILIDLENRKPVDLLPDREATSVEQWLKDHPGVEIISRDRGAEYIKGATEGAPDAIQVADRWHLLKNLRDNLKEWLETKRDCLKAAAKESKQQESEQEKLSSSDVEQQTEQAKTTEEPLKKGLSQTEKLKLTRQEKRLERYETVREMSEHGFSKAEIARRTKLDPKTIRKYIKAESCPTYSGRTRASKLNPYKDYIRKRFQEDDIKATQILDEIQKLGYSGGRTIMMDWVKKTLRKSRWSKSSPKKVVAEKVVPWSASRASWLLMKPETEHSDDEQQAFSRMKQKDEKITTAYSLSQRFVSMTKEHHPEVLLPWLEEAQKSGIDALRRFAKGIKQDFDAVRNALSFEWSQGQVEGQVNRLKLIKREMYGRANFDLLRKRVLFHPI